MFIPCDHCLRKHATHVSEVNERGEPEPLRLCSVCYQRMKQDLSLLSKMERHEEAIAAELQANLMSRRIPAIPGFDLSAFFRPSREVKGDYYEVFEIGPQRLGLVIADVSAKGVPGMIIMTETRALLKSEAVRTPSPAATLVRVNNVLHKDIKRGMFVTMYYAVLDLRKATLTCVSAGHNPMLLWRKKANTLHLVNPNGLALGIDKGPLFKKTLKEQKIELTPGDRFMIYTDGVIEAMNESNEEFGHNRLYLKSKELADLSSGEFLEQLMRDVERHCGDAPQHDDIAIVTGRFQAAV